MAYNVTDVLAELKGLLIERAERKRTWVGDENDVEAFDQRLMTRFAAGIERLSPPQSTYRLDLADARSRWQARSTSKAKKSYMNALAGIVQALHDNYKAGYMQSLQERIHSDLFSDFLDMAKYLIEDEGLKEPAAVLAGGVLEEHLRKLCAKHGVPLPTNPNLNSMNAELAKMGAYDKNVHKEVTAWAGIRNDAAHGKRNTYDAQRVRLMIEGIRHFITTNPA